MGEWNWPGFVLISVVALAGTVAFTPRRLSPKIKRLILLGTVLHIVGAIARYWMIFELYGGQSDAVRYYRSGLLFSEYIKELDFSFILPDYGRWWGTRFVEVVSGFVLTLIGPTIAGEALVFSMLSFVGLVAIGLAFEEAYPGPGAQTYQKYLWLWPSLWFWPSSVGKDALVLFGLGLVTLGYVGRRTRVRWPLLLAGLTLILCIRPHVAAMVGVALATAEIIGREGGWSGHRFVRLGLVAVFAVIVMSLSLDQLGISDGDGEGQSFEEFVEFHSGQSAQGGSAIQTARTSGALALPLALVNVLFRPFIFEARNIGMMMSAVETTLFWFVVWRRRKAVRLALKQWRGNRMMRLAIPLALIIGLAFGMAFGNLGIIARQRIAVLPFLFVLLAASGFGEQRRVPRHPMYSRTGIRR